MSPPVDATSRSSFSQTGVTSVRPASSITRPSALSGRAQTSAPSSAHRAPPAQGFTAWVGNIFRNIRSASPGGSRTHSSAEERTPLLQNREHVESTTPRAQVRLSEMSDGQLATLASQLSNEVNALRSRGQSRYSEPELQLINAEARVRGEVVSRGQAKIDTEVDLVLNKVVAFSNKSSPGVLAKYMHNAFSHARSNLMKARRPGELQSGADIGKATAQYVAAGLGRLSTHNLQRVLRTMSSDDIAQICALDSNNDGSSMNTQAAIRAARGEAGVRHTRLSADFENSSKTLLAQPAGSNLRSPAQLRQLTNDLHAVCQSLNKLETLCKARGQQVPSGAVQMRDQVAAHVRKMLASSEPDLAALSNAEMGKLRGGLGLLGIRMDPALLQKAAFKRFGPLQAACELSATTVLVGTLNGSPETALRGLKDLESGFNDLRDTQTAFSDDISGAQDTFSLRQRILAGALNQLSASDKALFSKKLHAPATELSPAVQAAFGKVLGIHWKSDGTPVLRT